MLAAWGIGLRAATDEAAGHNETGLKLAQARDMIKAESELRLAVELAPLDARYLSNLANILRAERKPAEASKYYQNGLQFCLGLG